MVSKRNAEERAHNLTPDELQKHYRICGAAKRALEEAQGTYQATLKAAKSAGVNTDVLKAVMKSLKRDDAEVTLEIETFIFYRKWLDKELGFQGDLFGGDAALKPTDKSQAEQNLYEAENAGYQAGLRGADVSECPHEHGTELATRWIIGMRNGEAFMNNKTAVAEAGDVERISGKRGRRSNRTVN